MRSEYRPLIIVAVLSGMAALIYEISWVRPIQFVLGSTIYTISVIFSSFMLGLSLGSIISPKLVKRFGSPERLLIITEIGIALSAVLMTASVGLLPSAYSLIAQVYENFVSFSALSLLLVFGFLLVPTTLMGITWPLFVELYKKGGKGERIGMLYSANNLGSIAGALLTGFVLIASVGVTFSIAVAAILNGIAALLLAFSCTKKLIPLAAAGLVATVLISPFASYDPVYMYRNSFYRPLLDEATTTHSMDVLFHKEGMYATVDVLEEGGSVRSLLINGKGQGGTSVTDMRVNYLLAYLGLLLTDNPENALIVGLGTGTTAGQLSANVDTKVVEIEPVILETVGYFSSVNRDVMPNIDLVIDDGRKYLLSTDETFDIIIPEPSDPWQDFSGMLFSKEFFDIASGHMSDDGVFIQWVPIYEMSPSDFRSFYATFASVFPHIEAFANVRPEERPGPYPTEIILVGSKSDINVDNIEKNFYLLDQESRDMLTKVMLHRTLSLRFPGEDAADRMVFLNIFSSDDMEGYGNGYPLITDDNMLLELSTARNLFRTDRNGVMKDIMNYIGGHHA
ncbi:MAG: fused MFS/spermidine synthase [Candidatus Aenigmarchaeota archaeon]|nr:fused MFS/spermidine synthase [Candidatus Aenigmarchaeota archaeon]